MSNEYPSEVIMTLQKLLQVNTVNPPGNELPLATWIAAELDKEHIESKVVDLGNNRGNVIGRIPGTGTRKALVLDGHLDVVSPGEQPWDHDPFGGDIVDEKIYGRGSSDMKSGVAAMLQAMREIKREGHILQGDLVFCASSDEETGSLGAIDFFKHGGLSHAGAVLIGEPNENGVTIAEKGCLWLRFTTYGKTSHGSRPSGGINAILHMNAFLNELQKYTFRYTPHPLMSAPTMNVSLIDGGVKTNVVPDACRLTVDFRTLPGMNHDELIADFEGIFKTLQERYPDFRASIDVISNRPPVETEATNPFVTLSCDAIESITGTKPTPTGFSGYTDAAAFTDAGIPIIVCGPGQLGMAHQPNEYVSIPMVEQAVHIYKEIIKRYLID